MQEYYQKHSVEFNNQYFNGGQPLKTHNICIKISKNRITLQALVNTQASVTLIINLFFVFSIFEQKKIGNFIRVAFEATRLFFLPAGLIRTFNAFTSQKKPCWHLTPALCFFIATFPYPGFSEKKSQNHRCRFEAHLKREI